MLRFWARFWRGVLLWPVSNLWWSSSCEWHVDYVRDGWQTSSDDLLLCQCADLITFAVFVLHTHYFSFDILICEWSKACKFWCICFFYGVVLQGCGVVCGHSKLKTLVANIALQHIKSTEAADLRFQESNCMCKMQWYVIGMLLIILLGMIYLVTNRVKKSILFGGHSFFNITKVILFISNTQSYVPINLYKIAGSIHLFKIRGKLSPENIKFKKNWTWDVLEIDWKEVKMTFNGNEINLPPSVILLFRDKYRARTLIRK